MLRLRLRVRGMDNVGLTSAQDKKNIATLGFPLGLRIGHMSWADRISAPSIGLRVTLATLVEGPYVIVGWCEERRQ